MLGFEQDAATGTWTATPEQIAWWESRDTCPMCSAIVEPIGTTQDGDFYYRCTCELPDIVWTREAARSTVHDHAY